MKCIAEVKPVVSEVPEIIKAIKDFDLAKVIEVVQKIAINGYVAGMKCYYIFAGEALLGESLPQWIIDLIYKYGRKLLSMLKEYKIEHYRALIATFMFRHGL